MNFEEHAAKALLAAAGLAVPRGALAATAEEAASIAEGLGPSVVKAQVPTGKRGKAGGIALAATPREAEAAARRILGMEIGPYRVSRVLVEEQVPIRQEYYAAVLNDARSRGPMILFSSEGGMDIEEIAARHPEKLSRITLDIREEPDEARLAAALPALAAVDTASIAAFLARLYSAYRANDAELLEVNPLALTEDGRLIALDGKFTLDDSAIARQSALAEQGAEERLTALERRAKALHLKYVELDGDVGILANGAGLTMATMDVVRHYGGRPANFLEIGGEAYTLGREALGLVLDDPKVKSLLVNFCGAFARTDVMTEGIVEAWRALEPRLPVFFTIHGTGEREAIAMVRERLGIEPFDIMDDAVKAAIEAAK